MEFSYNKYKIRSQNTYYRPKISATGEGLYKGRDSHSWHLKDALVIVVFFYTEQMKMLWNGGNSRKIHQIFSYGICSGNTTTRRLLVIKGSSPFQLLGIIINEILGVAFHACVVDG